MLETGDQAPSFSLTRIDGEPFSLLTGEQTQSRLLVLFETDCPTCRLAIPYINRLSRELGEAGDILGISQDPEQPTRELIAEAPIEFAVAVDRDLSVTKVYDPVAVPALFLIGNDGRIDSVEVTYNAASKPSVAHHSYVVTPSGVTYSGGGTPSAEEVAYVRADNAQFGQFRALERIFDGETIAIGSSFSPKKKDAEELLNVGESLRLRSMALTLRSVSDGVARFDVSIGIDADPKEKKSKKSATGAMSMTLDGTLLVTVATARPVLLDVSGPLQMNVKKPDGGHAADGSGNAAMRIDYTF